MDSFIAADPIQRRLRRLTRGEQREEAIAFVRQFADETGLPSEDRLRREREVCAFLRRDGHYIHSREELAFGARLAWRNHARCIGRLWWKSLEVVDCRDLTQPAQIAARLFQHMDDACVDGRIRSLVSVFAPARPGFTPPAIESPQTIQYAGYADTRGNVIGDRQNIELTRQAIALGWRAPEMPGPFDVLPLIIRGSDGARHLFDVPKALVREVPIAHPERDGLGAMGLKWYAVPCVTNMIMTIGGIEYPCAPFNGHYMATEVASRDLADRKRYNLLPDIARALGFDPDGADPLWRDRALTDLNAAVLHSFKGARVDMVDHHTASLQFMQFVKNEQREGRPVSADWAWIVPPQAGSSCPVFHLPMQDRNAVPNFYANRATDGGALTIDRERYRRGKWRRRYDDAKQRLRNWRRSRESLFNGR